MVGWSVYAPIMETALDSSFRVVAAALDRGHGEKQLADAMAAFGECVQRASVEDVACWLDALRERPRYVALLGRLYEEWIAAVIEQQARDFVGFQKLVDAHLNVAEQEKLEAAMTAACDDANPSGEFGNDPPMEMVVFAAQGSRSSLVEVRVYAQAFDGTMLWSLVSCEHSHPVAIAVYLASSCDRVRFEPKGRPAGPRPGPLDRYHPERFATWHPGMTDLVSFARAEGGRRALGLTLPEFQRVALVMMADSNKRVRELPHETIRHLPKLGAAPSSQAGSLAVKNVMWMAAGRQIFDLPSGLVSRFQQTDVDDVPLSMIKTPYPMLYFYWGVQDGLALAPGWIADGAYVSFRPKLLMEITVTSSPVDPQELGWWPIKGEPYAYQAFQARELGMDVGTAVDEVLAADLKRLREMASAKAVDTDAMLREAVDSGDVDPGYVSLHVEDVSARTAAQEIARLVARHVAYKSALKLVINALCYLTAYPDDVHAEYPAEAPAELVALAKSPDFKTAKRSHDRLAKLGYVPIHLCGRALQSTPTLTTDHSVRHVRPHWRRGHWRRQPYGEGRALRKLVWVMPVVVGSTRDAEMHGHIYLVS